jgi:hypothetical protein
MPQDLRNLQVLESFLPLIASPSLGPGVAPMHTYSTSIDNSTLQLLLQLHVSLRGSHTLDLPQRGPGRRVTEVVMATPWLSCARAQGMRTGG